MEEAHNYRLGTIRVTGVHSASYLYSQKMNEYSYHIHIGQVVKTSISPKGTVLSTQRVGEFLLSFSQLVDKIRVEGAEAPT